MSTSFVDLEERDGVGWLRLNDPRTRNALTVKMVGDLIDRLDALAARDDIRVVVLSSADQRIFSSGGDLKAFADDRSPVEKFDSLDQFPRLYRRIFSIDKPVICAANGDVLAGAFGISMACDLVIARAGVRFGCPEINVGVFPFMISALIYRNVPRLAANELMMFGKPIDANRALTLGVVNRVVDADENPDGFDDVVQEWAAELATRSPLLMSLGKRALDATRDLGVSDAMNHLQSYLALAQTTEDIREGVAAFREKRTPQWRRR